MTKRNIMALAGLTALGLIYGNVAAADDFHGFDPASYDGAMLSADQLQAMVKDASAVTPPRNG